MSKLRKAVYLTRPDTLLWRRSLLPTTALYFLNSYADEVAEKAKDGKVLQLGANTFRTGNANLVIRQDLPEVVAAALIDRTRRFVYLIDDNVGAYASDSGLPENYRKRLADRWTRSFQPSLRRADQIVVSSDYLFHHLKTYGPTVRMDPIWDQRLFEGLRQRLAKPASRGSVQVAYLGTGSHDAALAFLVPVFIALLDARSDIELTLPAGTQWPSILVDHPRVRRRWPVPWFEYEERLVAESYDLCLYPSLDTPFAAGRSVNKLTEQALTGALGLFSENWSHADTVMATGAGVLAQNTVECWIDAALQAIDYLPEWRETASAVTAAIRDLNDPARQYAQWQRLLGPELGL